MNENNNVNHINTVKQEVELNLWNRAAMLPTIHLVHEPGELSDQVLRNLLWISSEM